MHVDIKYWKTQPKNIYKDDATHFAFLPVVQGLFDNIIYYINKSKEKNHVIIAVNTEEKKTQENKSQKTPKSKT